MLWHDNRKKRTKMWQKVAAWNNYYVHALLIGWLKYKRMLWHDNKKKNEKVAENSGLKQLLHTDTNSRLTEIQGGVMTR